ncbi:MAG: hypothetical protein Q8R08_02370 [bacterium]|nr:hypothetical protein [bacterium]
MSPEEKQMAYAFFNAVTKQYPPAKEGLTRQEMQERRIAAWELYQLLPGLKAAQIAKKIGVSWVTARNWLEIFPDGRDALIRRKPVGQPPRWKASEKQRTKEYVRAQPEIGISDLRTFIRENFQIEFSDNYLCRLRRQFLAHE